MTRVLLAGLVLLAGFALGAAMRPVPLNEGEPAQFSCWSPGMARNIGIAELGCSLTS